MKRTTLNELLKLHEERKLCGAFNISNADYHAAPGISKSACDDIADSPAKYRYKLNAPTKWTEALIFGSAYHYMLGEPEEFDGLFYITKTQPKQPEPDSRGRMPISDKNFEKLTVMVKKMRECPIAQKFLTGLKELSFFATHPASGVLIKVKPDVILPTAGIVGDWKTTTDVSAEAFSRAMMERRYHVQGALILDVIRLAQEQAQNDFGIKTPDSFVLIAHDKSEAPYEIAHYQVGPNSLVKGEEEYTRDLETYAKCATENVWPGATTGIQELELPLWYLTRTN